MKNQLNSKYKFKYERLKKCPYCSSLDIFLILEAPDRLTHIPGKFYLSKCKECGLVFQNPRVGEDCINIFYNKSLGYYNPPKSNQKLACKIGKIRRFKRFIYRQTLVNNFNYTHLGSPSLFLKIFTLSFKRFLKIQLTPTYVKNGRLLEIGCSYGARLEYLKKLGWSVKGIEMDKKTVEYAVNSRNLDVENKKLEEVKFPPNKFEVIIMSMVLEHLYQPFDFLRNVTSWLKPGGQLIFSIPYFEGFEFHFFKEYSYGMHLPHHTTFFNKRIIKNYLKKLGYRHIKFYFQYFDRDIVASAYYKYLDSEKWIYKFIAQNKIFRKLIIKPFVLGFSLFRKTSRVTVYANKGGLERGGFSSL